MLHVQPRRPSRRRRSPALALGGLLVGVMITFALAPAAALGQASCLRVEAYTRKSSPQSQKAQAFLAGFEARNPGVRVDVYDVETDAPALARLKALAARFNVAASVPTFYAGGRLLVGFQDEATTGSQVAGLLTMEVFTRNGCPRCAAALPYLGRLQQRYPGLRLAIRELTTDPGAQARLQELANWYSIPTPGTPTFHYGGRLIVGWNGEGITGQELVNLVGGSAAPCRPAAAPAAPGGGARLAPGLAPLLVGLRQDPAPGDLPPQTDLPPEADLPGEAPLPGEAGVATGPLLPVPSPGASAPNEVRVPMLGTIRVGELGLPLFTVLIGLIDGFNPCAMWVLIFLLTVLVGLNDRRKMLLIAGTFVVVSGLAYFAFMAAWFNVFRLIGHIRQAQVALGVLAVLIGAVHVKDFFAFKKGLSLSIPESAKPGIYERVRRIVTAKNVGGALAGAVVLAVLVNTVELLCTAGLPAIYTQVLSARGFPLWKNYLYLGLYIAAYMFDDAVMVGVVVTTLSRRRLQEKEGRYLKLVSGVVILALGLVMLLKPEWLA
jgi:thiol-disulfide isomerase/thioredoxin